jgi:hypothetical protein
VLGGGGGRISGTQTPGGRGADPPPPPPPPWAWSVHHSVYYISKVLHEAETRYLDVHKLLYAVLIASRKLHHYF